MRLISPFTVYFNTKTKIQAALTAVRDRSTMARRPICREATIRELMSV